MSGPALCALGIDVGSATTKVVGVDADGELVWHRLEATHPRMEQQSRRMLEEPRALDGALPVVATGYGRKLVPGATRVVTEITCHAHGVFRRVGQTGTLIDLGGQDSKVILVGSEGRVIRFAMNDKCAAGTGRFLEVTAARLQLELREMGEIALAADREEPISSTCTVFAESEIVSLLARGEPVERIVRGLHRSLVSRLAAMVRSVRPRPPFMLSGGVAKNLAVRAFLGESIDHPVEIARDPQLMGAYGAALLGLEGDG